MLYVTVFVAGAMLMALEMLGSRVLAPDFGNSIFVWGSLIGVVLAALSVGYYVGGYLADRFPSLRPLALVLGGAGFWVWWLPDVAVRLDPAISAGNLGPRLGPLLAALALFAGPAVLLALVSPWAVRLAARDVATVGRTAGVLYGVSTVGSIAGTLLTAFTLIPLVGVATLTRGVGLGLMALSAANLILLQARGWAAGVTVAAVVLAGLATSGWPGAPDVPGVPASESDPRNGAATAGRVPLPPTAGDGQVYRHDSQYHFIRVEDRSGVRYLQFDNSWQSAMYLSDPLRPVFAYTDYLQLPFAARPDAQRALLIGLGGGTVAKQLHTFRPRLQLDVAELDPAVLDVARRFFSLPESPRLTVHIQDGRQYVARAEPKYDVVMLDAYYAESIPFHLTTREFFAQVREKMTDQGMMAINVIGALEGPRSALLRSVVKTLLAVFPEVYLFPVNRQPAANFQNVVVVAARTARRWTPAQWEEMARKQSLPLGTPALPEYAAQLVTRPLGTDDVPILTDDHAPVDRLLHLYR